MDRIDEYRQNIQKILMKYTKIPYAYGEMESQTIFDHQTDRYMLITIGWDGVKRVHDCLVHIDIIQDKVWLQRDHTDYAIAHQLEALGIPKTKIVLGFRSPDIRPHTGYAVA